MVGAFVSASVPGLARADVSLPPPPPKKSAPDLPPPPPKSGASSGGAGDLPPPPAKKKGSGESGGRSEGGGGGGGGGRSPERTTAIVLLVTGGAITATGTVMLLLGAGLKPNGKAGGSNTGLLVGGGVATGVGLAIATVGLVLLLDSNNGRLPPIRSISNDHPALRMPTWQTLAMPTHDAPSGFVVPFGGTF